MDAQFQRIIALRKLAPNRDNDKRTSFNQL